MNFKSKKLYIILAGLICLTSCDKDSPLGKALSPQIEIKEIEGNGDNIPNKGENLNLIVTLNGVNKEKPSVTMSSTSSFITITDSNGYFNNNKANFKLEIDKSTPVNTEIPLSFKYSNVLGFESTSTSSIKVLEIDNKNLFQSLEIKEIEGNGDNVPNRGESISITPTFVNKGASSSNELTIALSSKSSFVTITDSNDYIRSLKPNAPQRSQGVLKLTIDKTVAPNTEIPLDFKLTDRFGNEFNTSGSFKVIDVNNDISFQSLKIKEIEGNGDNVPNRGESISITPTFVNKGASSSNELTIALSSKSSFVTITDSNDYIRSLKPNAPQKSQGVLKLTIDKTVAPNTEIPLDFKLTDRFGNEFNTIGSFIVR